MKTKYIKLRNVTFEIDNGEPIDADNYQHIVVSVTNDNDDMVGLDLTQGPEGARMEADLPASVIRQLGNAMIAFADMNDK